MSVYLLRNYQGFAASATVPVTLPADTEASLIAQGLATAAGVTAITSTYGGPQVLGLQGGNVVSIPQAGESTPTYYQGPLMLPNIALGSLALASYETAGVAGVAGTMYLAEIYVPYFNTWTGAGILNGTTVGTDKHLVALYGTNGALLANSAVAGVTTASASIFQNIAFTSPIGLQPGRYFLGCQTNGTTDTRRHILAANGSNVCTGTQTGTFGTIPATLTTIPVTFTTAVGVIMQLYT